jgi:DNA-binding Lrp family transcriptional regulator
MANTSLDKHVDTTVKLVIALLTEPRLTQTELSNAVGVTPNVIARMLGRFRQAGLVVEYDYSNERYRVNLADKLERSVLGPFAKKIRKSISESEKTKPPVKFIASLDRYTVPEWADAFGTSPENVYNMITGYKGQKLPAGWVAYQMKPRTRWFLKKMETDRSGLKFVLPDIVNEAHEYHEGTGEPLTKKGKKGKCLFPKCPEPLLAKGMCNGHYYQVRRHPEMLDGLKKEA